MLSKVEGRKGRNLIRQAGYPHDPVIVSACALQVVIFAEKRKMSWLQYEFLSNTVQSWLVFAAIVAVTFALKKYISIVINYVIYHLFKQYFQESRLKQFQEMVVRHMQRFILLLVVLFAVEGLYYPDAWKVTILDIDLESFLHKLLKGLVLFSFIRVIVRLIDFGGAVMKIRAMHTPSKADDQMVPFVRDALKILMYLVFFLILLGGIFKLNVTSLLTGLGIGGLAIAFAAQESIKDLFGSITVFLDKPFLVGDTVKVGEIEGTVEKVGFRSTRIRTYDQTYVTLPNKKMLDTNVDNLTLRHYRRVKTIVRLSYATPVNSMRQIISELKSFLESMDDLKKEIVVSFDELAEGSLNIQVVYFIPILEPDIHNKRKEEINFRIMEIVEQNKAALAVPGREIRFDAELIEKLKR